jgi:hypothetical protein
MLIRTRYCIRCRYYTLHAHTPYSSCTILIHYTHHTEQQPPRGAAAAATTTSKHTTHHLLTLTTSTTPSPHSPLTTSLTTHLQPPTTTAHHPQNNNLHAELEHFTEVNATLQSELVKYKQEAGDAGGMKSELLERVAMLTGKLEMQALQGSEVREEMTVQSLNDLSYYHTLPYTTIHHHTLPPYTTTIHYHHTRPYTHEIYIRCAKRWCNR